MYLTDVCATQSRHDQSRAVAGVTGATAAAATTNHVEDEKKKHKTKPRTKATASKTSDRSNRAEGTKPSQTEPN